MAALDFVHLHVHSNYSLLEGAIPLARLADLAKADKQAALALDRHRQHVRCAGILRKARCIRHPADRRLRARHRFWRHRPWRAQRQRSRSARAHRAAGRARSRLSQPDAAVLARLPRYAAERAAAAQARMARRRDRRRHRAHRRAGRPARWRHRRRPKPSRHHAARRAGTACSATGSMSNCSATARRTSA